MTDEAEKRYTVKVGFAERLFLEEEHNRLRREALRRTGSLERVTYGETLGSIIAELAHYRDECSCVDQPDPGDLLESGGALEALAEGPA